MDIDQSWHDHAITTIDLGFRFALVGSADMANPAVGERDIGVAQIHVSLVARMPGDDPGNIADDGGCHGPIPMPWPANPRL